MLDRPVGLKENENSHDSSSSGELLLGFTPTDIPGPNTISENANDHFGAFGSAGNSPSTSNYFCKH